jgi:hypothetical protein
VAKTFGGEGRIFAHRLVRDVFGEKQFGRFRAGHVVGVVQFDEEVVEAVSAVEHTIEHIREGNENG